MDILWKHLATSFRLFFRIWKEAALCAGHCCGKLCCPPCLCQSLLFLQIQNYFLLLLQFFLLFLNQLLLEDMAVMETTYTDGFFFLATDCELLSAAIIQELVLHIVRCVHKDILAGNLQVALYWSFQRGAGHIIPSPWWRFFPQRGYKGHHLKKTDFFVVSFSYWATPRSAQNLHLALNSRILPGDSWKPMGCCGLNLDMLYARPIQIQHLTQHIISLVSEIDFIYF